MLCGGLNRRFVAGLLMIAMLLLFPHAAWAAAADCTLEDIRNEISNGWNEVFIAHDREINIDLDADTILLPPVQAVPLYKVEMSRNLPKTLPDDYVQKYREVGKLAYSRGEWRRNKLSGNNLGTPWDNDVAFDIPDKIDWGYRAEGSPITLMEADEIAQREISRCTGEEQAYSVYRAFVSNGLHVYDKKTNTYGEWFDHEDNMGMYALYYHQTLAGLPILLTGGGGFFEYSPKDEPHISCGAAVYVYDDYGFDLDIAYVEPVEKIYDDVPLLPFSEIRKVIVEQINQGKIRGIRRIQFGYVLYHDAKDSEINWAVPTWMIKAEYYEDAQQKPFVEKDPITKENIYTPRVYDILITAQSGEFIDPTDTSDDRRVSPKTYGWADGR